MSFSGAFTTMKFTNQRAVILDFLKGNLNHPTVEEIYDKVKKTLPRITKATVYKNLETLVNNGYLKEVNMKGVSRFEAKINPHHHIICKTCDKIIDFESDELIKYSLEIINDHKDFTINSAETTFFGTCKACSKT